MLIIQFAVLSSILLFCECQRIPEIGCPDVFKYAKHDGLIYGQIQVPNDHTGVYEISVNVSLATLLHQANIRLTLLSNVDDLNTGSNPIYRVDFPIQHVIPKITQILFNGRIYCSVEPEPLTSRGVTNMWASRSLITNIIPGQSNNNPGLQQFVPPSPYPNNPFLDNESPSYQQQPRPPQFPNPPPPQTSVPSISPSLPWPGVPSSIPASPPNPRPEVKPPTIAPPRVNPPTRKPPTPINTPKPPSSQKPFTSNPAIQERDETQCGIFSQQLIVGGTEIQKGQFPWLVAIFQRLELSYKYRCTGNLVSSKHVVSAGHCFKFMSATYPKEDYSLILGKQDIYNWATESTIRGIKQIHVHNNYKQNTGDYDIAVVTFDRPVEFGDTIRPLCIWQQHDNYDIVGKAGTVVGWGTDGENQYSQKAKKIDLDVVSNEDCLRSHWGYVKLTSERTFCAGGQGVGPCVGDSGAGIVMQRKGRWTLRGIVSQALQSNGTVICDLGKYIVFADVKSFSPWIETMMT